MMAKCGPDIFTQDPDHEVVGLLEERLDVVRISAAQEVYSAKPFRDIYEAMPSSTPGCLPL